MGRIHPTDHQWDNTVIDIRSHIVDMGIGTRKQNSIDKEQQMLNREIKQNLIQNRNICYLQSHCGIRFNITSLLRWRKIT